MICEFSRQPYKLIHLAPLLFPLVQASLSNRFTWQKYNGCSKERESISRKRTEWANLTFTTPISSMETKRIRIALIRKEKSLFSTYERKKSRDGTWITIFNPAERAMRFSTESCIIGWEKFERVDRENTWSVWERGEAYFLRSVLFVQSVWNKKKGRTKVEKESPRRDLNPQSLPPEGNALSIRPHGLAKVELNVDISKGWGVWSEKGGNDKKERICEVLVIRICLIDVRGV